MLKKLFNAAFLIYSSILVLLLCGCQRQGQADTETHMGWVSAWAEAGLIVSPLIHSDILSKNELVIEIRPFSLGPQMNEAALAGEIEIIPIGIVPAASLFSASDDWIAIARLVRFALTTAARIDSPINNFTDLRGKLLAFPFGAGPHPYILSRLRQSGLRTGEGPENVQVMNLRPPEQVIAMEQKNIDAAGTFEPALSIMRSRGLVKVIDQEFHDGYILAKKSWAESNPDKTSALLRSFLEANFYVARNRKQVTSWYARESGWEAAMLDDIEYVEPNFKAENIAGVTIDIGPTEITAAQKVCNLMFEEGLLKRQVDFAERVDLRYLKGMENR